MKQNNILIIVVIAVITIGSVYWWQQSVLRKTQNELQSQIDQLNKRMEEKEERNSELVNQVSELDFKINNIEDKIKKYLKAEGKITIEGKNCEEEFEFCLDKLTEKLTATSALLHKDFPFPYSLSWTWSEGQRRAEFSLTGVSLGKRTVPPFVYSSLYQPGEEIYALTFYSKIRTHWEDVGICLPTNFRLVLNEEGDLMAPINQRFNTECPWGDKTYSDQEVIFVVPESQKEFTITTGGESNIFFEVTVLEDGDFKVEKIPASGPG